MNRLSAPARALFADSQVTERHDSYSFWSRARVINSKSFGLETYQVLAAFLDRMDEAERNYFIFGKLKKFQESSHCGNKRSDELHKILFTLVARYSNKLKIHRIVQAELNFMPKEIVNLMLIK